MDGLRAVWEPVLHHYLSQYTWRALLVSNCNVVDVLNVQDLRIVCKKFRNIVTAWFLREWNYINWNQLFVRFMHHYNWNDRPRRSVHDIAVDYFSSLITARANFNGKHLTSCGFLTITDDSDYTGYPLTVHLIISDHICCVLTTGLERYVMFVSYSGVKLCPDRWWIVSDYTHGFAATICLECVNLKSKCSQWREIPCIFGSAIMALLMPQTTFDCPLLSFSW
jgi:hypothetical protein